MSLLSNILPTTIETDPLDDWIKQNVYGSGSIEEGLSETYEKIEEVFENNPFEKISTSSPTFTELGIGNVLGTTRSTVLSKMISTPGIVASQASASQIRAETNNKSTDNTHKVMLVSKLVDNLAPNIDGEYLFNTRMAVVFENMPEVQENRNVDYESISPPHLPGEFQKYRGTKSTQWTIVAKFTARTRDEAAQNYQYINTLRGWTMPFFGQKQIAQSDGRLGAPPPVLDFSGWRGLVGTVPVVLTNLSWSWPVDVDWLPTGLVNEDTLKEIPFPTVLNATITLTESFSAAQFNGFDLGEFRAGRFNLAYIPDNPGVNNIRAEPNKVRTRSPEADLGLDPGEELLNDPNLAEFYNDRGEFVEPPWVK